MDSFLYYSPTRSAPEPVRGEHLKGVLPDGFDASETDEGEYVLNVTAVGVDYCQENGFLSSRDQFWLRKALTTVFEEALFAKAASVCVTPYDLNKRHDILDPSQAVRKADLFLVCYVPQPRNEWEYDRLVNGGHIEYAASRFAINPDAWRLAAQRTEAKMIATYVYAPHNPLEVSAEDFSCDMFLRGGQISAVYEEKEERVRTWMQTFFSKDFARDFCRRVKNSVFCKEACSHWPDRLALG